MTSAEPRPGPAPGRGPGRGPGRRTSGRRGEAVDVVIVAYRGVQALDVTGPHEVFAGANDVLATRPRPPAGYRVHVASIEGGPVATESGLELGTRALADVPTPAILLLPGGRGVHDAAADPTTLAQVGRLAPSAGRLVTVCSGAFLAAAAGLVSGRRMTTHWARAGRLAEQYPDVVVDPDPIHLRDGHVWSSAGVTAGIDLALAIVEDDHGAETAQTIARWLVMFLRRPGGQSQFAAPVWTERADDGPVRVAQESIELDPAGDHRVAALAARVGMSERHFTRCFTAMVGTSPAQYVIGARLDAARRELERTGDTLATVARRCGFGTAETMRRTFVDRLGTSPDAYRRRFRTTAPAPGRSV